MSPLDLVPAATTEELSLSSIIGALSYALDLTEGLPAGHSLRCCWIGMHVGQQMGMDSEALSHLYYTLLLKDAGCSSNAARLFELYGTDDRLVKRDFKLVDTDSLARLGRFVMSHSGVGKSLHERVNRILNLARNGEQFATELITTRCERGANIALQLGFDEQVADGIRCLDEHWNGRGKPSGLGGKDIPLNARIALLSQVVEVFYSAEGRDHVVDEMRKRSGSWFDPAVVDAFLETESQSGFWDGLRNAGLQLRIEQIEPASKVIRIDEDRLDTIAEAFPQVVDAKSNSPTAIVRGWQPTPRPLRTHSACQASGCAGCAVVRCCTTSASSASAMPCWTNRGGWMQTNGSWSRRMRPIPSRSWDD